MKKILIMFILLFLLPASVYAQTYYVDKNDPSCTNSNGGTEALPWCTIQKAANTMVAGDTVIVKAGTYNERVSEDTSGSEGNLITYQANPGDTVTVDGGFTIWGSYVRIDGFRVTGASTCIWTHTDFNIYIAGDYVEVANCYLYEGKHGGIMISPNSEHSTVKDSEFYQNGLCGIEIYGKYHLIENNEIHDSRCAPCNSDADGIHFFGSGHIIRGNYIHDITLENNAGYSPHIDCFQTHDDPADEPGRNITFDRNHCENYNEGHYAFMLEGGTSYLTFKNNIIEGFGGINSYNNEPGNHHLTIINNHFIGDLAYASGAAGVELRDAPYCTIKNNVFYDYSWVPYAIMGTSTTGLDRGYNLAYRSDGQPPGDPGGGGPTPTELWGVDPKLADPDNYDYTLQSDSPAIDAGADLSGIVDDDYDGNSRPQGSGYDMGAYEYSGPTGNVYYVSTTGNDNNPGTESLPWRTIQKAANTMVAGDTVIVNAGTYNERVTESTSGSSGNPITYQVKSGDTVWCKGFVLSGDYIVVDGFEVETTAAKWSTSGIGIYVIGSHNEVKNNYVHDCTWRGIHLGHDGSYNVVRNNYVYQCAECGIWVSGTNCMIEDNEIDDIRCEVKGVEYGDINGMSIFDSGHTIRRNYIHDCLYANNPGCDAHIDGFQTWSGGTEDAVSNTVIERNKIIQHDAISASARCVGFMLLGGANNLTIKNNHVHTAVGIMTGGSSNFKIVSNTFVGDISIPSSYIPRGISLGNMKNVTMKNNIISDFNEYTIWNSGSTGLDYDYQSYWISDGSTPSLSGVSQQSNDLWKQDPKFVNLPSSDFHLEGDSPCINAGADLSGIVDYDYDDVSRPQGSGYDMGAYEYSGPTGNVYYVSTTGNDNNPGTESEPWCTIQKAANTMVAGDTVTVYDGTYAERVTETTSGSEGNLITYQVNSGDTVSCQGFVITGDYIKIDGFTVTATFCNWNAAGIWVEGSNCIIENNYAYNSPKTGIIIRPSSSDCIIRNNQAYLNSNSGITIQGYDHLVEANEVWGSVAYHEDTGCLGDADGFRFFGSGHTFKGNYIHDINCDDPRNEPYDPHIDAFQTWPAGSGGASAGTDIIFEQNWIDLLTDVGEPHEVGHGWMLADAQNLTIRNNIVRTFRASNTGGGGNSNLSFINNIFIGDLSFSLGPSGIGAGNVAGGVIKNNIFYDIIDDQISISGSSGLEIDYNCFYRSDDVTPISDHTPGENELWGIDPKFVNVLEDDFHLQPDSPAIDVGADLSGIVDYDYDDVSRPQGSGYDMGAYEYSGPTGNVYYVSTTGNDNNPGTESLPWGHCPGMAGWGGSATLSAGDTVYFDSVGTWTASSGDVIHTTTSGVTYDGSTWGSGTKARFRATGALDGVVLILHSDTTFKGIEVDAGSTNSRCGICMNWPQSSRDISNILVEDCVVHDLGMTDDYRYGIIVGSTQGNKANNVVLDNCKVYNVGHEGIVLYPSTAAGNQISNVIVRNCEVYNTGMTTNGFGDGVFVKNRVINALIERNYLHDNDWGVMTQCTSGLYMSNITVRHNRIQDNRRWGFYFQGCLGQPSSWNVYGNLISGNGISGYPEGGAIFWVNQNHNTESFKVYGNTIYCVDNTATSKHCVITSSSTFGSPTIEFKNNIVYADNSIPLDDRKGWITNHNNNNFYRSSGSGDNVVCTGWNPRTCYNRATITNWEPSIQNSDPLFQNPSTGDFSLQALSPAIDNGANLGPDYNIDITGKIRTGIWDMGAYEYVGEIPPGLVAYWKFDEDSGTTAYDSSGNGNDGTLVNGPIWTTDSKSGNALDFDGVNDYTTMGTSGFNPSAGTVEVWANIDTFPSTGTEYIFSHKTSPTANRVYIFMINDAGTNKWGTGMGDTYELDTGSALSADTWYHFVLTWDGTNVRGYKDGNLDFGPTAYSGLTTVGSIWMGSWDGTNEYIDGTIDEVRIYNRALSLQEIQALYNISNCSDSDDDTYYAIDVSCPGSDDCDDNNASINPGATEICNNIDEDCDLVSDNGFTNENCQFVCQNNGYNWAGTGGNLNCCGNDANEDNPYQPTETSCSDGNDNDCDSECDYDSMVCSHGDINCLVGVTGVPVVSENNPCPGETITVTCTSTVPDVNSIDAYIDSDICNWDSWSGNDVIFNCTVSLTPTTQTVKCAVDSEKSYQSGTNQTTGITVGGVGCCSDYANSPDCEGDSGCDWCNECSLVVTTLYSGGVARCVSAGGCSYYCDRNPLDLTSPYDYCNAICDDTDAPCPDTECDGNDGCYAGTYRDYSDMLNICLGDCTCESNACTVYTEIPQPPETSCSDGNDNDCDGEKDWDTLGIRGPEHGDSNCPVGVTGVPVVSDNNPCPGETITVTCTSTVPDVNSVDAYINTTKCSYINGSWSGNDVNFTCIASLTPTTQTVKCAVDSEKSYQSGTNQTTGITVGGVGCCSDYANSPDCEGDSGCDWCNECSLVVTTLYSGGVARCVSAGGCSYYCDRNPLDLTSPYDYCNAICDDTDAPCPDTECDGNDGCYAGTYRDYSDMTNYCLGNCTCESNACTVYNTITTDIDGDGYDIECDNDCDDNNINIHPGATEVCDGLDNDCDGEIDENNEICNNIDDDCDNEIDEDFNNETCKYVCENNGFIWLSWGDPLNCCGNHANEGSPYEDPEATCDDGQDNDCDGSTDSADSDCGGGGRGRGGGWGAGGAAPGFKPNIITLVIILFLSFFLVFYDLKRESQN